MNLATNVILCPCHSGKSYSTCCAPYHQGKLPETPVDLMRSRYSAYALGLADYILKTTHPKNPAYPELLTHAQKSIQEFCSKTSFKDLKILEEEEAGGEGFVTFRAYLFQEGKEVSFTEKSRFLKEKGVWLYVDGTFL